MDRINLLCIWQRDLPQTTTKLCTNYAFETDLSSLTKTETTIATHHGQQNTVFLQGRLQDDRRCRHRLEAIAHERARKICSSTSPTAKILTKFRPDPSQHHSTHWLGTLFADSEMGDKLPGTSNVCCLKTAKCSSTVDTPHISIQLRVLLFLLDILNCRRIYFR